jgi:TatD DNase family protein
MELIDTHCHLDVAEFDADRAAVLERCRANGVTRIVVPAIHAAGWESLQALCDREPGLYPALGLHPVYLEQHRPGDLDALRERVARQRPLAIGEIGLDYFIEDLDRARQQALFEAQLRIARDADLPVIVHVRKAHDQVLKTLRRIQVRGGIIHAFNGSQQQGEQYQGLGFRLGFGGTLTYEGSKHIRRLARDLPLDAIVLETDAPDITVASHRGERNSPEYLPECLAALAEVREEDPAFLARATGRNAEAVLGLTRNLSG